MSESKEDDPGEEERENSPVLYLFVLFRSSTDWMMLVPSSRADLYSVY